MPKLSIITVNLNNSEGLQKTIESVISQTYTDFEYIIIDGGSTDGSVDIIKKYTDKITYWVSENDSGIYNAMNKGIKVAKGEYCQFLNSGDALFSNVILNKVAENIINEYKIYYGNVQRIYSDGRTVIKTYPEELSFSFFIDSALAHQSVFIKRTLFYDFFFYNEKYKILADWDFLVYAICKKNTPYKFLDFNVSDYNMNGISSQKESREVMKKERIETYNKYFPLFYKDYQNFHQVKSKNLNLVLKIEKNKKARKILYFILRIINKLIK